MSLPLMEGDTRSNVKKQASGVRPSAPPPSGNRTIQSTKWISVDDELPKIPAGKYGISVLVAVFDSCYEEINPNHGYSVYEATYLKTRDRNGKKSSWYEGTDIEEDFATLIIGGGNAEFGPIADEVTHWMYMPAPPIYKK